MSPQLDPNPNGSASLSPDDRALGCLIGGALGDALGAPVEFASLTEIRQRYGHAGISAPPAPALFTDDTQMTLFTAEALVAPVGPDDVVSGVWDSYRRWLITQTAEGPECGVSGLAAVQGLYVRRAPGVTCLSALQAGKPGSPHDPINNSKGCGGVMRVAPIGLVCSPAPAAELATAAAALTHGHRAGWAPAGALALLIAELVAGADLAAAVAAASHWSAEVDDETARALKHAIALAESAPSTEHLTRLGEGWIASEALAIAVYAALSYPNAAASQRALILAANHGGDSDSTAAIAGNILGTAHGVAALPREWVARLELLEVIERVAHDVAASRQASVLEMSADD